MSGKNSVLFMINIVLIETILLLGMIIYLGYREDSENFISNDTVYASLMPAVPVAELPKPAFRHPATLMFCGDVLLDGSVKALIYNQGTDAVLPIEFRDAFLDADVTMINLEMPFSNRGIPMPNKEYTYRADPSHMEFLNDMGVDIVSLANNHTLDYGTDAFWDTMELLKQHDIRYVGGGWDLAEAKSWQTLMAGSKKVAYLAASRVIPTTGWYAKDNKPGLFSAYDPSDLYQQITSAKEAADYVMVYLHWGSMNTTEILKYQQVTAYGCIDAGADAVIGAHPHVLQGFEFYKGKLIAYSLGNFIFSDLKKDTAALEFTINEDESLTTRLYPFEIVKSSTAPITDAERLAQLRRHLNRISIGAEVDEDFTVTPVNN